MAAILADLPAGGCHWPVGPDPGAGRMATQLFCAEAVPFQGCPYCETHLARGYPPNTHNSGVRRQREARAADWLRRLRSTDPFQQEVAA